MVEYLESMRNYFYKQYKNGKKKRISFESYNLVMKGGEHGGPAESGDKKYDLRNPKDYQEFIEFVQREFTSTNGNNKQYIETYTSTKTNICRQLNGLTSSISSLPTNNHNRKDFPQIFYIYDNENNKIIFIRAIDGDRKIQGKNYKHVKYLLRRPNTVGAGRIAIYHILTKLNEVYDGIYLIDLKGSAGFYNKLKFSKFGDMYYFDKDRIDELRTASIENTELVSLFDKIY